MRPFTMMTIGCTVLLGAQAPAGIVTLVAQRDNTLYQPPFPHNAISNALGPSTFAGKNGEGYPRRVLLDFNLSSIPAGATIESATLTLVADRGAFSPTTLSVHRLAAAWGQGTSNAGDPGGQGTFATPSDPTWFYSHFNATPWTVPGGDFAPAVSATVSVDALGSVSFQSAGLAADVQYWMNNSGANFGWIIIGDESQAGAALRFSSVEGAVAPTLTITFLQPQPCGTSDFNGDGASGLDDDIEAFFLCLGGNCCDLCWHLGADFNGDGASGLDNDIEAFFIVLGGGSC